MSLPYKDVNGYHYDTFETSPSFGSSVATVTGPTCACMPTSIRFDWFLLASTGKVCCAIASCLILGDQTEKAPHYAETGKTK